MGATIFPACHHDKKPFFGPQEETGEEPFFWATKRRGRRTLFGPQEEGEEPFFRSLLGEEYSLDVGEDTTLGNGNTGEEFVQFLVIADGQRCLQARGPQQLGTP